jgi:MtN3 and saliva related transmembrane protein
MRLPGPEAYRSRCRGGVRKGGPPGQMTVRGSATASLGSPCFHGYSTTGADTPPGMSPMKYTEMIGWASSVVLLATLLRQVYTQWKSHDVSGVSRWLFIGQVTASVGFTIYSLLLRNWVYASSNIAILMTAIAGEIIYLRNKHAPQPRE